MVIRVYVGDLGDQGSRTELERAFSHYGDVSEVWVARNPPGFAFVFFESYREAEKACRNLDGTRLCGVTVRVEIAKGPEKGEKYRGGPKCRECGRIGHTARECTRRPGYVYRGKNSEFQLRKYGHHRRGRSRSYSRERSYGDRYEYNSYENRRRSRSRSYDRRRIEDDR